ncbi:MAG: hypothetical protein GX675_00215 [Erysipelotrichaceae bacterium]|nr:hypothetical protein [Erysipelotrichaceae bacterium]
MKALLFNGKKIHIDFSTNDLLNKEINSVLNGLKEAGFNNYKSLAIKDIYTDTNYYVGHVQQVIIGSDQNFTKGKVYDYDTKILIKYHSFNK